MVAARRSNFQCAPCVRLATDVGEVDAAVADRGEGFGKRQGLAPLQHRAHLKQRAPGTGFHL